MLDLLVGVCLVFLWLLLSLLGGAGGVFEFCGFVNSVDCVVSFALW